MYNKTKQPPQIDITQLSDDKMIDILENNLKKQLNLMRACREDDAVDITEKNNEIIEHLSDKNIMDDQKFRKRKEHITNLIKQISLAAAARQEFVSSEIKKLSRGKKSLSAYKISEHSQHSNLL